jgi:ELWxxDGT repeat protein
VDLAGTAIFSTGPALYRTDGTAAGTHLIRAFDRVSPLEPSQPWRRVAIRGNTLYFTARDRPLQGDALWRTDGTAAGTSRISQRDVGPFALTRLGRHIFFAAAPGSGSGPGLDPLPQLWMSDGTKAGTRQVGQILDPGDLTVLGGRLYFDAQRLGATSQRLYASDGTAAGTRPVQPRVEPLMHMVKEVGRLWSNISVAEDGEWQPDALRVSDGTAAGTSLVYADDDAWIASGEDGLDCVGLGDRLYFAAGPGPAYDWELVDQELWTSDGTTDGTLEAADIDPDGSSMPASFTRLGDTVYFTASDGVHGRELWRFDPGDALQ